MSKPGRHSCPATHNGISCNFPGNFQITNGKCTNTNEGSLTVTLLIDGVKNYRRVSNGGGPNNDCCTPINCWLKNNNGSSDFLNQSKLEFVSLKGIQPIPYPIKFNYRINKGLISVVSSEKVQFNQIYNNGTLYTILSEGTLYSTNVVFTLIIYRKNLAQFLNVNTFTTMGTTYFINKNSENFKSLNALWKKKIGFNSNDYNFYEIDYYYDYYVSSNSYALDCIRICSIKVFLWNLIYNLAKQYNIDINFEFYETFYTCIFENLDGTKPILAEQVNIYFKKYYENFMPIDPYNSIIVKWSTTINLEKDVINQLIFKQASFVLNLEQLEAQDYQALFTHFDYQTVKFRFLECLSVNKPATVQSSSKKVPTKEVCSGNSSSVSKSIPSNKSLLVNDNSKINLKLEESDPLFVMYYANWCGHCKIFKPEFEKLGTIYKDKIKIMSINPKDVTDENYIKNQKITGFPELRYYHCGLNGEYEKYKGLRNIDSIKLYLKDKIEGSDK